MNVGSVNNTYMPNQAGIRESLQAGTAAGQTVNAFEKVITVIGSSMNSTDVAKTMNGISEGISSVEEALKADAKVAKDNLKALFNKLSGEQAVKLDEDGFDINELDDEELVTVVDRIKIMLAAYNENFQAFAGAFDMPEGAELEGENLSVKVAAELKNNYLPQTKDNTTDVISAMEMAADVSGRMPLSEQAKAYLVGNELEPTIENIYKANHTTRNHGYVGGLTDDQWKQIMPQVASIIKSEELPENDKTYEDAKWLIANEIPVTADNLKYKNELDEMTFEYSAGEIMKQAVSAMAGGKSAAQIGVQQRKEAWIVAAGAIRTVSSVSYGHIANIVSAGHRLTIEEMEQELKNNYNAPSQTDEASLKAYRVLCETRVIMTASSTISLIRRGIDIYNEDLTHLKELLQQEETRYIQEQLSRTDDKAVTEEDLREVSNTTSLLNSLRFMPAAAIGATVIGASQVTVSSVHSTALYMQRQYEQAGAAYETMSTKARSDMGDSVKAALDNSAGSILNELGYENNGQNLRAVRIMAYNSMEMSEANFVAVREADSILNNLMDNMSPQVVYQMIKDRINPMNTDISTLNDYIADNYDVGQETVKYSEFLYKLEKTEGIDETSRRQYIGIYKMFNAIKKDRGKAVGALLNQNAEISLNSLMTAVDSRNMYGMDVTLSENAGMSQGGRRERYYRNLFSEISQEITPAALDEISKNQDIGEMSPEKLMEMLAQYKQNDKEIKEEYYSQIVDELSMYRNAEDEVIRLLTDHKIPVNLNNLAASKELLGITGKNRWNRDLLNEDLSKRIKDMPDVLDDSDDLEEAYNGLEEAVREQGEQVITENKPDSYADIRKLHITENAISLMNRLGSRREYFVPFETEDGIGAIHLKLVRTGENAGKMEMNFYAKELGNVYAQFMVNSELAYGYITSDGEGAEESLKSSSEQIKSQMTQEMDFGEIVIQTGNGSDVPHVSLTGEDNGVPTVSLYRIAKLVFLNLVGGKAN